MRTKDGGHERSLVPLGQVCRVVPGYAFSSRDWTDSGIPVVKIQNIRDDCTVDLSECDHVSQGLPTAKLAKFVLKDGDIILAMTGATAGKVGKLRTKEMVLLNQRVAKVEPVAADPPFIWAVLSSREYRGRFFSLADGAAQPNMSGSQIEGVLIPLPDYPIQRKIGSIVAAYDSLIENNTRRIKILEEMAQAIYRERFVHFRFPGHKKVRTVNSPLGSIPEGWKVGEISDVASISRDSVNPADCEGETFEHFSIPAYDQGRLPTLDLGETIKSNKYVIAGSCVLLSKLNPRIPRVWLPILSGSHRAVASTEFLVLAAGSQSSREFLYCLCASPEFLGAFAGRALGTSTSHQRVKPDDFLSMKIVVPGKPIILEFSELVAPMLSAANALRLKNQNLRQTRDLLLPKLISGEVDVSEMEVAGE